MVPLVGHANIMRYACIQSCRIDVGVEYLMIIRISVQLGKKGVFALSQPPSLQKLKEFFG